MKALEVAITWSDVVEADEAVGPELWTMGDVTLRSGDVVLSRAAPRDGVATTSLRMPLSGLAEWIVECWPFLSWDVHTPFAADEPIPTLHDASQLWARHVERGAGRKELAVWQHRHTLGHATVGVAMPAVVLVPGMTRHAIAYAPPARQLGPSVTLDLREEVVWGSRREVLATLEEVVDATLRRAERVGRGESERWTKWLGGRWSDARATASSVVYQREQLFGPIARPELDALRERKADVASVVEGLLADTRPIADPELLDSLVKEVELTQRGVQAVTLPSLLDPAEAALPPHEQGYRLAERMREAVKNADEPFPRLREVTEDWGVATRLIRARRLFRTAAVDVGQPTLLIAKDDTELRGVARTRFALAAAIGRLLFERSKAPGGFGAGHGPYARLFETKRANAFAAELLLPQKALRGRASGEDVADLCADYGISSSAARWHIRNRAGGEDWRLTGRNAARTA